MTCSHYQSVLSLPQGEEKDGDAEGDDSDEDDGFFVPHGYLSNDEGDCSDSGEFIPGPNDDVSTLPRTIPIRLICLILALRDEEEKAVGKSLGGRVCSEMSASGGEDHWLHLAPCGSGEVFQ